MNEKKYYYNVYGLFVESEIIMPELISMTQADFENSEDEKKVFISLKNMPESIKKDIESTSNCSGIIKNL